MLILSHFALQPWHVVPELGGDGGKNMLSYLYHIRYENGWWFGGQNYPYGEHIAYADGQPLLSVPLGCFKGLMSVPHALTVMWWFISLGYVLCVIFLFRLLVHFKVRPLHALIFAVLITMLTPQQVRLAAHYALASPAVIPMLFYWTAIYHETHARRYAIYIFLLGLVAAFLHPYFVAVLLVWVAMYSFFCLFDKKRPFAGRVRQIVPLLIAVLAVFGIFGWVMRVTDPCKDRPVMPFGMLQNCSHIKDMITSPHSPIWNALAGHRLFTRISDGGEGFAYIGIAALVVLAISLAAALLSRKKDPAHPLPISPIWLLIAFCALLLGMGVPFIWKMDWLADHVAIFRQFRTLGRFSWIFYYVASVYAAVVVSNWYRILADSGRKILAYTVFIAPCLLWAWEGTGMVQFTHAEASKGYRDYNVLAGNKNNDWAAFLKGHGYSASNFQAILVLPFFENGSEKLWVGTGTEDMGISKSLVAGLQLHLPTIDAMMSRTSWGRAFGQVRLVGGPFTSKPLLQDLHSDKPFLVIVPDYEPLTPDERYLLECTDQFSWLDSLGHFSGSSIYILCPSRITYQDMQQRNYAIGLAASLQAGQYLCTDSVHGSYVAHLDDGRLPGICGQAARVDSAPVLIPVVRQAAGHMFELSCWFQTFAENYKSPDCRVDYMDIHGQRIRSDTALTRTSTDNMGLWLRMGYFFTMPAGTVQMKVSVLPDEHNAAAMDELQLRPADAALIYKTPYGQVWANNHLLSAN